MKMYCSVATLVILAIRLSEAYVEISALWVLIHGVNADSTNRPFLSNRRRKPLNLRMTKGGKF